ncbi:hypothetical protein F0U62_36720 [Cystobacter fuscus]|uniref:hypothetical protein n=1 Tax=Cystobacter fuscus TaxID=43 RepID=UPI002B2BA5D3|nr:hypothetical protein F0U62_36720 [Cystobacter fuscus]
MKVTAEVDDGADNSRCSPLSAAPIRRNHQHSAPVIISAILLLVENRLHQLGRVLRGEENPAHLLTPHNTTTGKQEPPPTGEQD